MASISAAVSNGQKQVKSALGDAGNVLANALGLNPAAKAGIGAAAAPIVNTLAGAIGAPVGLAENALSTKTAIPGNLASSPIVGPGGSNPSASLAPKNTAVLASPASKTASSSAPAGAPGSTSSVAAPGYSATDIINYLNNYGNSLGQAAAQYTQSQYANAEQNLANQYALNTELGTNAYKGLANSTGAAGTAMAGDWNAATKADAANAQGNQSLLTNSANSMTAEEGNIAKALGLGTSLAQPVSNLNQVTQNAVQNLAGQAQTAEQGTNANAAAAQQLETNMGQNFNNASALANIQGNEAENTALGQMAQQATQAVTNARYQFMPSASDLGNYLMTDPLNQAMESKYGAQSDEYEAMGAKDLATAQATQAMSPQVATLLGTILGGGQTAGTAAASLSGNQSSASSAQQAATMQALQMYASLLGGSSTSDLADSELLGQ